MSQFFISCKESRIENNRSFYGCFYLGPFEPSQSITIANALRRTLLSELNGLAIISVEIEGASHEYSSLPGVRDSVLDILLNLKEIVLKKTIKNFKPQIGYLRVRGPGVVRASHLRLPPFIQCVDPDQYIATLADNGFLNMKFIIQYGNKWSSTKNTLLDIKNEFMENKEINKKEISQNSTPLIQETVFNLHLKKRRLIFKKLKQLGIASTNSYINLYRQSALYFSKYTKKNFRLKKRNGDFLTLISNKKYRAINLKSGPIFKKMSQSIQNNNFQKNSNNLRNGMSTSLNVGYNKFVQNNIKNTKFIQDKQSNKFINKKLLVFKGNPLIIDAIFNPINKVNYIIENNDFKTAPLKMQTSVETFELYEMLKNIKSSNKLSDVLNDNFMNNFSLITQQQILNKSSNESLTGLTELDNILQIKDEINILNKNSNNEMMKHNLTLEIWTNGSIHPRDALYQGFKNLIKLFTKLNKINSFSLNNSFRNLNSLSSFSDPIKKETPSFKILSKKIKMNKGSSIFLQDLFPLNETSFLSTYISPKLKNYYLNTENLSIKTFITNPLKKKENINNNFISKSENEQNKLLKDTELSKLNNSSNNKNKLILDADISILNLSLHSYTSLKRLKINNINDLLTLVNNDLANFKKLSKTSIEEIKNILSKKISLNN